MSKALDALRAAGFFNPSRVLTSYAAATGAEMPVAILYEPHERGRVSARAAWVIYRPGFKTDPREGTSRWWEYGQKTFNIDPSKPKPARLEEAKLWASERYGVNAWASVPGFRDVKFPAEVAAWLKHELKENTIATPAKPPAVKAAATPAHTPQRAKPRSVRSTS
ncbi:hypothetical protein [Tessaracoccus sp.]